MASHLQDDTVGKDDENATVNSGEVTVSRSIGMFCYYRTIFYCATLNIRQYCSFVQFTG